MVLDAVDADVDHHRATLEPAGIDQTRAANRRHDDVGQLAQGPGVVTARMHHRHRAMRLQQQGGHGFADDVGTTDHHRMLAAQIAAGFFEQVQAAAGRAGRQYVTSLTQASDVFTVKAVYVLARIDSLQDAVFF